jgi:peptidoglycan hydrolase-like protein with peptidoglycan-binding domain
MNRRLLATVFLCVVAWTSALADPAIEAAQQRLKDQGFYYGEITGKQDADTIAAIRRYQIRNGLKITGDLNVETQQSLGLSSKPAASPKPRPAQSPGPTPPGFVEETPAPTIAPRPRSSPIPDDPQAEPEFEEEPAPPQLEHAAPFEQTPYDAAPPRVQQDIIMQVQIRLMRQGYYRDEIDGLYGPTLNSALRSYQARFGLRPSGRLDVETLAALNLLPEQRVTRSPRFHPHLFPPWSRRGPGGERIYIPR